MILSAVRSRAPPRPPPAPQFVTVNNGQLLRSQRAFHDTCHPCEPQAPWTPRLACVAEERLAICLLVAVQKESLTLPMTFIRLLPVVFSLLLLAAHFLRAGGVAAILFLFVVVASLLVRKRWVARFVQVVLVVGALEWVRTAINLVFVRQETGEPWTRMVIILGSVALFTLASALVFRMPAVKRHYDA